MASLEDVSQLRRMTQYQDTEPYDDVQLAAMIDASDLNHVASLIWSEKAAELAGIVDVSESGSSRKLGDAYKNALAMSAYFKKLGDEVTIPADTTSHARTRNIVRESA